MSLVQFSCRRYQPRGLVGALSWRVARRRSGSRMVAGVRGGCPGSGGGGLDGLPGSCASTSMHGWPWLGSAGLGGAGWLLRCETGLGALWWCLGDLWMEMGGVCGARSGLVDVWVMHGMVMEETLHVCKVFVQPIFSLFSVYFPDICVQTEIGYLSTVLDSVGISQSGISVVLH